MGWKRLVPLLSYVFVDVLGYSLFFPLLPYYAAEFGAGAALVGMMIASNALAQFIASPVVGYFSDRYGRRPLIMLSIIGTLFSFLLLGLADPLSRLLVANHYSNLLDDPHITARVAVLILIGARIFDGLMGGNVALARAYVTDVTSERQRAQGLGLIGAVFGLGFFVGPAIGGTLSNWEISIQLATQTGLSRFAVPAFVAALFALVNFVTVILSLPESFTHETRQALNHAKVETSSDSLWHNPRIGPLLIIRFGFSMAITLLIANFALYTRYGLALDDQTSSYLISYAGILIIFVQAVGVGWLSARIVEDNLLIAGLIIVMISFLALIFVQTLASMIIVLAPLALCGGLLNTVINSLISKAVPANKAGGAMGIATSAESATWFIAPAVGGILIEVFGGWSLGVIGALITGFVALYAYRFLQQLDKENQS